MGTGQSVKISGVIIAFNEERNIERCLQSLVGIVDEIVVVDSFSTDGTFDVCKKFNVRWVQHPFKGYIQQKNYAMGQASYTHVLSLDADEALSEEMKAAVLAIKKDWRADGYMFNRLNNYCGKALHYSWYPDAKIRLWNREKGAWGGENPHDMVIVKSGNVEKVKADILHYPYRYLSEHIEQIQKFSAIAAKAKFDKGKKPSFLVHVILNPIFKFIREYIFKRGFLDGYYGFLYSIMSAFLNFSKYAQLWEMHRKARDKKEG